MIRKGSHSGEVQVKTGSCVTVKGTKRNGLLEKAPGKAEIQCKALRRGRNLPLTRIHARKRKESAERWPKKGERRRVEQKEGAEN